MSRTWIFQANPNQYRIDDALQRLDIHRLARPTVHGRDSSRRRSRDLARWKASGNRRCRKGDGIPRESEPPPEETAFLVNASESVRATRVPVRAKAVPFVPKKDLLAEPGADHHQILTAPMGTVFPLSEGEADRFLSLVPPLPAVDGKAQPETVPGWPSAFAWRDRRKAVYPLPGGQEHQLDTLAQILAWVSERPAGRGDLERWLQQGLGWGKRAVGLSWTFYNACRSSLRLPVASR
jgi:hypothetical protein